MTKELQTKTAPVGIIAKLASTYDMEAGDFEMMLVRTIFPKKGSTATKEEVAALCLVASEYGLNPLTKQIYAFPNKQGGITPIIGVDGWYALMNREPEMDGLTFEEFEDENGLPVKTVARLYRKDRSHPIEVTERYKECVRNSIPWDNQPFRMLRHRAAIQAIRVAFGIAALDPDDAERIPDYEAQAGQVVDVAATTGRVDDDSAAKELGSKYAPNPVKLKEDAPAPKEGDTSLKGDTYLQIEKEYRVDTPPEPGPDLELADPIGAPGEPDEKLDTKTGEVTHRKRRSRAILEQRIKFDSAMANGWIDPGLIASSLPDVAEEVDGKKPTDDSLEAAFAIMWSDDAEEVLEKIKAAKFKPAKGAETAPQPPEEEPEHVGDPEPGGAQRPFDV